jgi:hypothetical protein
MARPARSVRRAVKMRRIVAYLIVAVLFGMAMPAGVAAEPTSICPDGMVMVPTASVVSGDAKDKNQNGFVCAKYIDSGRGGPDDRSVTDDIVL